jgi:hypothetical protein
LLAQDNPGRYPASGLATLSYDTGASPVLPAAVIAVVNSVDWPNRLAKSDGVARLDTDALILLRCSEVITDPSVLESFTRLHKLL